MLDTHTCTQILQKTLIYTTFYSVLKKTVVKPQWLNWNLNEPAQQAQYVE